MHFLPGKKKAGFGSGYSIQGRITLMWRFYLGYLLLLLPDKQKNRVEWKDLIMYKMACIRFVIVVVSSCWLNPNCSVLSFPHQLIPQTTAFWGLWLSSIWTPVTSTTLTKSKGRTSRLCTAKWIASGRWVSLCACVSLKRSVLGNLI